MLEERYSETRQREVAMRENTKGYTKSTLAAKLLSTPFPHNSLNMGPRHVSCQSLVGPDLAL